MRFPSRLSLLACAGTVLAAAPAALHATGAFNSTFENDKFFAGSDRHYTQGLKVTYTTDRSLEPGTWPARLARLASAGSDRLREAKLSFSFGQNLYTPNDTSRPDLVVTDRPYAAWLYTGIAYHLQSDRTSHVVDLTLGVVGPSAQGEFVQNTWHDFIGVDRAEGWDNQLRDEPAVTLSYEWRHRVIDLRTAGGLRWFDAIPRVGFTVGNVATHATTGLGLRAGWRLPSDFGPDLIRGAAGAIDTDDRRWSAYFFAAADVRAVARNIFLDGNTWRDSHSVEKREFVGDFHAGLAVRFPVRLGAIRAAQLHYTQNYRTKDFELQPKRDVFGSAAITLLW